MCPKQQYENIWYFYIAIYIGFSESFRWDIKPSFISKKPSFVTYYFLSLAFNSKTFKKYVVGHLD